MPGTTLQALGTAVGEWRLAERGREMALPYKLREVVVLGYGLFSISL